MKYFLLIFFIMTSLYAAAQHCPYDGFSLVGVKLVDKNGKKIKHVKGVLYLKEIDNPEADSCTYAPGLLKKTLLSKKDFAAKCDETYRPIYSNALKKRLKQADVFEQANLMVAIIQPERTCMVNQGNEFDYRTRKFVVSYYDGQKELEFPVPAWQVRPLCTAKDGLKNFEPVTIKLTYKDL